MMAVSVYIMGIAQEFTYVWLLWKLLKKLHDLISMYETFNHTVEYNAHLTTC